MRITKDQAREYIAAMATELRRIAATADLKSIEILLSLVVIEASGEKNNNGKLPRHH